ncbi:major facilitator superfamily domain-containing protein [Aspergillus sergii]|uniref:Major facilitator superfamily domain-containing protein n=1 Tax=Aspergillus sergii TaxID=1034303 RepID=A0A5N6WU81_9EURO|nr:major facilitator superfamily domain-containing protein [Aspergillus sergii]
MASACHDAEGLQETISNPGSFEEKAQDKSSGNAVLAHTPTRASDVVYSAFSKAQKRYIVFCTSWAGFFSPVSSQIYYPALNTLAHDLHVSGGLINLTLMSYMVRVPFPLLSMGKRTYDKKIFQGLSPMFVGDFADKAGRRPAYIGCFILYIAANIGLALQNNYAALFVLRCLQSAGISTTIALGSGVVSDIATAAERGSYMGFVTAGTLLGPSVGPVIGGLLAQYLGWRAIFWFLTIFAGTFTIQFLLFFPETARKVVGNGSLPPPTWNLSLINWYQTRSRRTEEGQEETNNTAEERNKITFPNPLRTLSIVFQKDTSLILLSNAILFAGFYDVSASIPSIYEDLYNLNDLQIGLCYIPFGLGATIASIISGKILDYNYRRLAKQLNIPLHNSSSRDLKDFPIEKARLQLAFPLLTIGSLTVIAFGWVLHFRVHLAAPTTILFVMGLGLTGAFNTVSTLLVDLYPGNASAATASNNFVRCLLGAGATALIDPMLNAMGRGWCFTFITFVMLGTAPLLGVVVRFGPRWREERYNRPKDIQRKETIPVAKYPVHCSLNPTNSNHIVTSQMQEKAQCEVRLTREGNARDST